ncbi:hypothetical protein I5Q34_32685 [Streptomyces sp. AV19]|uniref:hypothetical protein n=1 Tax=Streptomyces sp. AV19 TaxID=2793068 RepID=UPI0018FE6D59|nr:hypothetical protein [Streptomyces sp. AV19]MBH1938964.1 hypothetical protein [Streptomyces sp. AV19]MDG4535303.1 hypothetical protein [Streptomyces sp. AV19]
MERTHPQPAEPPDPTTSSRSAMEEPATLDRCAEEYAGGVEARDAAARREELDRSKRRGHR